jgi:hypothetical protein
MDAFASTISYIEGLAARNDEPELIARMVRLSLTTQGVELDFGQLVPLLEARITELSEIAEARPDHAKLKRGVDKMRRVSQLLDPSGAEAELTELAEKIRVCVTKADNYAVTAGRHLRQARERCREIGLDFNKWCAQANLGIKRSRIYQLMGPDPIATERQDEKHNVETENVQSVDIAQLPIVEHPIQPGEEQAPLAETVVVNIDPAARTPEPDPFAAALAQFEVWFAGLTITQQRAVVDVVTRVRESPREAA